MTDAGRRRIDVSSDVHSRLDAESKRRNIPIRDLVEQAVTTMFDREAQAALSVRQQRERRHADRMEEQTAQIGEVTRRVSALIAQQSKDLPGALNAGFDAIKTTIKETGGTGHLRDLIAKFQTDFTVLFKEAQGALAVSVGNVTKAVEEQAKGFGKQLDRIEKRQSDTRTKLGVGAALGIAGLVLICLLFANTAPTRWLSIRLLGESDAVPAAWSLAGDGRTTGELMAETKGLLASDTFRVRYAECAAHAKRMKKPFPCRLTFPPLESKTP
ncbi:hypothetical protein DC429_17440 [Arthrobacter sp. TPD3018]|jgi:hypothetical protein|uniref:Uncharacterized protein n=1 Tax=Alterirhizorhabdus solaris TaxID=2529389 RepID=A0A558REA3_9SPHN|nr:MULTISPECIES: hypothetical protein [Bacteria]AXJ97185.1 hypothetical protein DM480_15880 [Sphingomonas sp. FARSPH]MBI0477260.1 hypothetical protein [Sphingomonas sp. MA1305]MCP8892436.1 hypothetical protein [Sphingomonas faeni]MDK8188320.1 hypothetical protein [Sphingomonas zeae]MDK8217731.1 hypothetical protein [Sphingomonas sp. UMB7805-LC452B]